MNSIALDDLKKADGFVILAGAGMGIDSGLPDFRGKSGLWTDEKTNFVKYSSGNIFHSEPLEAWNFYIERIISYRNAIPHKGYFDLLKLPKDIFVVTSNIDRQFLKAGYDENKIYEIHGCLRYIQCSKRCCNDTQDMPEFTRKLYDDIEIPKCPKCNAYSRPQVMLFNDPWFVPHKATKEGFRYLDWSNNKEYIVGIEIGAGLTVPSIRLFGQERTQKLIRINPSDYQINRQDDISISKGALEGIDLVMKLINGE